MIDVVGYRVEDNSDIEESIINAAKKHYKSGKYDMAIQLYLGLLKTSASSKLYMDVGLCYYKKEDYNSAIEYLTLATSMDIRNSIAYSYLGNCYFKKLNANKAIENWTIARSISPKDEHVCLNLAISFFAKNMSFESIYYYDKYLKYSQNKNTDQYKSIQKNINELFQTSNGYYIEAQKNKSKAQNFLAEKNYIHAVKKYPIIGKYSFELADLYYDEKNYVKAIQYYEIFLKENSKKSKETYLKMAKCYQSINDYRRAYCFYNRYLKYTISSQKEYLEITRIVSNLKRELDTSSLDITLEIAKQHYEKNEYYESLLEYENYIILNPKEKSNYDIEIKKLKSFINSEHRITRQYLTKGNELLKQGEKKGANKYFTEVMHLSSPKSEEYRIAKSKIHS